MFIKYATFNINSLQKTTTCKFPSPVNKKKSEISQNNAFSECSLLLSNLV